jgi:poly(A) polymerase
MSDTPALHLTPPFAADPALSAIWDALPDARVVGGAVRDAVAGRPVADIDLATPQPPDAVTAALTAAGLRAVPTGLDHGTVTAIADGRGFEVTTLRRDLQTDGRHAVVAFTADWRQDALRRDFTINALSMNRAGAVFDYFSGIEDLQAGRVQFVGDPDARIREDYLRILRFFRFWARYGQESPNAATTNALQAGIPGLARLSIERVWAELSKILAAPDPVAAIGLMQRLGILQAIAPEIVRSDRLAVLQAAGAPADPIIRLAAMLTGDPLAFAQRMKLSNEERDRLAHLQAMPDAAPGETDEALRRKLASFDRNDLIDRTWLNTDPMAAAPLRQRLATLPKPIFSLEGRDVLALGLPPGPVVGTLLRAVRQWWLDGGCVAEKPACLTELTRRACESRRTIQDGGTEVK